MKFTWRIIVLGLAVFIAFCILNETALSVSGNKTLIIGITCPLSMLLAWFLGLTEK